MPTPSDHYWKSPLEPTGQVTAISDDGIVVSLGFNTGLSRDDKVAIIRDGKFICNCDVKEMLSGYSRVVPPDGIILQRGDSVALYAK